MTHCCYDKIKLKVGTFVLVCGSVINACMSAGVLALPYEHQKYENEMVFFIILGACACLSSGTGWILWHVRYEAKNYDQKFSFRDILKQYETNSNVSFQIILCFLIASSICTLVIYIEIIHTNVQSLIENDTAEYIVLALIYTFIVFGNPFLIARYRVIDIAPITILSFSTFCWLFYTVSRDSQGSLDDVHKSSTKTALSFQDVVETVLIALFAFTMQSTLILNTEMFFEKHKPNEKFSPPKKQPPEYLLISTTDIDQPRADNQNQHRHVYWYGTASIFASMAIVLVYYCLFAKLANDKSFITHKNIFEDMNNTITQGNTTSYDWYVVSTKAAYVVEILVSIPFFLLFVSTESISLLKHLSCISNHSVEKNECHNFLMSFSITVASLLIFLLLEYTAPTKSTFDIFLNLAGGICGMLVLFCLPLIVGILHVFNENKLCAPKISTVILLIVLTFIGLYISFELYTEFH